MMRIEGDLDFAEWIADLYHARFSGKIELHFLNGIPQGWNPPAPRCEFRRVPRKKLDKAARLADSLSQS